MIKLINKKLSYKIYRDLTIKDLLNYWKISSVKELKELIKDNEIDLLSDLSDYSIINPDNSSIFIDHAIVGEELGLDLELEDPYKDTRKIMKELLNYLDKNYNSK